jgi:homoserine dehydrogenase
MKRVYAGLLGFGNIGTGVIKILRERQKLILDKTGLRIEIARICDLDIHSKRSVQVDREILTRNFDDILSDPHIDIVIELMGGIHPAYEFTLAALSKGKHVVTANKALLAHEGRGLFTHARDMNKSIYFEASVGAGIPIIKSLREGLIANKFNSVFGIVNGTSNYVLSQMAERKCSFQEALKDAKNKGFAEKDPSLDIEGVDSAHKLIILTYLCFGKHVRVDDLFIEGITTISQADINYAKELGFEIKLLAIAKKDKDSLSVRVHPTLLPKTHLLSSVQGVNNAIAVSSDLAGNLLFYGPGAGQSSAASAVVSDLIDLSQDIQSGLFRQTLQTIEDPTVKRICKIDDIESRYYIRFTALDKPGVLAGIAGVLSRFGISIASVTQKERKKSQSVPIVMIVHDAKEKQLRKALEIISRLKDVTEASVAIRMEEV